MQDKESNERRSRSSHLIEGMLAERNQLLSLLLRSSNIESDNLVTEDEELLEEFCQVLVDYIAAGHFGLYDRIVEGRERRTGITRLAKTAYPEIERSTQLALEFSEKYKPDNIDRNFKNLSKDLSVLGESLTTRIELEDRLISGLLA